MLATTTTCFGQTEVDTQLVLLIDSSGSIKDPDYFNQIEIIRNAFRSPNVYQTIQSGFHQKVAVKVIEFAGWDINVGHELQMEEPQPDFVVAIDWIVLSTEQDIEKFINMFPAERAIKGNTNTALGLSTALESFDTFYTSKQYAIDVFTDGHSDDNYSLKSLTDSIDIETKNININSIVIDYREVDDYQNQYGVVKLLRDFADFHITRGWKAKTVDFDHYQIEQMLVNNFSFEIM